MIPVSTRDLMPLYLQASVPQYPPTGTTTTTVPGQALGGATSPVDTSGQTLGQITGRMSPPPVVIPRGMIGGYDVALNPTYPSVASILTPNLGSASTRPAVFTAGAAPQTQPVQPPVANYGGPATVGSYGGPATAGTYGSPGTSQPAAPTASTTTTAPQSAEATPSSPNYGEFGRAATAEAKSWGRVAQVANTADQIGLSASSKQTLLSDITTQFAMYDLEAQLSGNGKVKVLSADGTSEDELDVDEAKKRYVEQAAQSIPELYAYDQQQQEAERAALARATAYQQLVSQYMQPYVDRAQARGAQYQAAMAPILGGLPAAYQPVAQYQTAQYAANQQSIADAYAAQAAIMPFYTAIMAYEQPQMTAPTAATAAAVDPFATDWLPQQTQATGIYGRGG